MVPFSWLFTNKGGKLKTLTILTSSSLRSLSEHDVYWLVYLDSSILWWVEAYNWSIWEEKWCSHTSYSRRFVMSLFRDYTFQYGLLRCCWCYYKTSPFWVRERRGKENWTKKDMSCYAAFLSYFSSGWRSPLLWTILIPNEVRKKKTSVGYECHAWNVRPLCLRWKWMSLLWSIFFVQVQDHICIACVKCGITRSSKSLIHMVWKLLKMSHLNFGIFHHFLCD